MTQRFTICLCTILLIMLAAKPAAYACAQIEATTPRVEEAYQLAAGYYERGQWAEAKEAFQSIVERHPETEQAVIAHFFLGEALVQDGDYLAAKDSYQRYRDQLPHHEFSGRALFRMGESNMRLNELTSAIRLLEDFVQQYPNDSLVQFGLAYLGEMRMTRSEPQLAQRVFERSLQLKPAGDLANQCRYGLARSLQMQGDSADALRFYRFMLSQDRNPLAAQAQLQAGIIEFSTGNPDLALDRFTKVVALPTDAQTAGEARYWLARIAMDRADTATALEHFLAIDTSKVKQEIAIGTWFDGAVAAVEMGENDQAAAWLDTLCHTVPDNRLVDDALCLRIRIAQQQDDSDQVEQLTELFLTRFADSPFRTEVIEAAGRNAYAHGDYPHTIELFSKLLTAETVASVEQSQAVPNAAPNAVPNAVRRGNWAYFQSLGHLAMEEHRNAESLLKSISGEANTKTLAPLVEIALGTARFAQEKYAAAVPNYQRYLELLPNGPAADQARLELTLSLAQSQQWVLAKVAFEDWAEQQLEQVDVGETAKVLAAISRRAKSRQNPNNDFDYWCLAMADEGNSDEVRVQGLSALAWLKTEQDDASGAADAFKALLDSYPNHPLAAQAGVTRAKLLEDQNKFEQAAKTYAQVVQHFPNTELGNVAKLRSAYLLQRAGDVASLKQARQVLTEWLGQTAGESVDDQLQAEAIYQLGWINNDLGGKANRDVQFKRLFEQHPDSKYWPDAAYRLAESHVANKQYSLAKSILKELVATKPCPAKIRERGLYMLGQCEARQQQWSAAAETFGRLAGSTEDKKLSDKATYWLAESLYREDRFEESRTQFQCLNDDIECRLNTSLKPWVQLRLAQCLGQDDQWAVAKATASQARQRYPRFSLLHEYDFIVARGLEDAGRLFDAIEQYQAVIDSPDGGVTETAAIAQWRIGEVLFHQEKYAAAIGAYYRVDSIFGYPRWRSAALLQAGKCQEHLKNWKHAEKLYRQLLENFPASDFASDASERLKQVQVATSRNASKTNATQQNNQR